MMQNEDLVLRISYTVGKNTTCRQEKTFKSVVHVNIFTSFFDDQFNTFRISLRVSKGHHAKTIGFSYFFTLEGSQKMIENHYTLSYF